MLPRLYRQLFATLRSAAQATSNQPAVSGRGWPIPAQFDRPLAGIVGLKGNSRAFVRPPPARWPAKTASSRHRADRAGETHGRARAPHGQIAWRLVSPSITVRPRFTRNAAGCWPASGCRSGRSLIGQSSRTAWVRSSRSGSGFAGKGPGRGAHRRPDCGRARHKRGGRGRASASASRIGATAPGSRVASMNRSAVLPGPSTMRLVARPERLRRLAVERHDGDDMAIEPQRDHPGRGGIDAAASAAARWRAPRGPAPRMPFARICRLPGRIALLRPVCGS